ncbi:MAG: hypothetical protein QXW97_01100 [Candidatus Pacearchaeota archaeon]
MKKIKKFFERRSLKETLYLKIQEVNSAEDLTRKIDELKINETGILLTIGILPENFYYNTKNWEEASRKAYKHGKLIQLPQPKTQYQTYNSHIIPLEMRAEAFLNLSEKFQKGTLKESQINYIGYSWRPVQGRDKIKRAVNFIDIVRAAQKFSYASKFSKYEQDGKEEYGIKVKVYGDAKKVKKEGALAIFEVPSKREKVERYKGALRSIPFKPNSPSEDVNYNLAISLSLAPCRISLENSFEDEVTFKRSPHSLYTDLQYKYIDEKEYSYIIRFSPEEIAGYMGIIYNQLKKANITPLMFNPFALPSRHQMEFYKKMHNNVLIKDPSLKRKNKLRHLHLAEESLLLTRAAVIFGHDDFIYWDPVRDKNFRDYNWNLK